jgi:hypothetical protein
MDSKVKILLWERWKRTRWPMVAAILLPLVVLLKDKTGYTALGNTVNAINLSCLFFLTVVLVFGLYETKNVELALPKRLFRLPVRTSTLLIVFIGYGIVAVALQYLIIIVINGLFLDLTGDRWTTLLIFMTVYITFQTLSWIGWPALVFGMVLWVIGIIALPFLTDRYYPNIICPIIILICCTISFFSVSAYRHSSWINGFQWTDSFLKLFRRRSSKPFASPMHAQIWFESRQKGHIFPLSVLCTIIILLIWWKFVLGKPPILSQAIPVIFMITVCIAFVSNFLIFGLDNRGYVSGASLFWIRKPMPTQTLAVARLYSMILSLGYSIMIIIFVTSLIVLYEHGCWAAGSNYVYLITPVKWAWEYKSPLEIISMTILGLYGFIIIYWTMLRLGMLLFFVGIAAIFSSWLLTILFGDIASTWMWETLFISFPLVGLISFYVTRRLYLITTATLVISAIVFPIVVVSLWAFPWWFFSNAFGPKGLPNLSLSHVIMLTSSATLPFLPVALTPLIMNKLRHR